MLRPVRCNGCCGQPHTWLPAEKVREKHKIIADSHIKISDFSRLSINEQSLLSRETLPCDKAARKNRKKGNAHISAASSMSRRDCGVGNLGLLVLALVWLLPGTLACIHLLNNQWKPLSVAELAEEAEIVVTVYTRKTFKEVRTEDANTYSAEFRILQVLKGGDILKTLPTYVSEGKETNLAAERPLNTSQIYNISNFGDKSMCYADVSQGEEYILYLTTYEGRLSARYDDLFSAAAERTDFNEQLVLESLGWKAWSDWAPCSTSCGGGTQSRQRGCKKVVAEGCEGDYNSKRKCNRFSCKGAIDLLTAMGVPDLPQGVSRAEDRPNAFRIDSSSTLSVPTKQLFQSMFPIDFSVITVVKPEAANDGYLLTISDLLGFVKLGIQMGENPVFEYSSQFKETDLVDSPFFPVDLSGDRWHHLAYSVKGSEVTLIMDCYKTITRKIERDYSQAIGLNTVISIGKTFIERKSYPRFEGDIEQLLIVDNPAAAEQHCGSSDTHNTDSYPNYENGDEPTSPSPAVEITPTPVTEVTWSDWSSCSATCGRGVKARTAYCSRESQSCEQALAEGETIKTKKCRASPCRERCRVICYNGGVCESKRRCSCPLGFYGRQCEIVSCYPTCVNGGRCIQPNKCSCLPGYTGTQCELAQCHPECQSGGKCVRPGVCVCPYGYLPPDCRPICGTQCYNGGTCVGFNYCRCLPGYSGNLCQNAVCENGCGNGGECIAPNTCQCASGYTGKTCNVPICVPPCLNGGSCLFPFFCLCPYGTYGSYCQNFLCSPRCLNGGTCIGLNTCSCTRDYSGQYCQIENCPIKCSNGGRCIGRDKCQCPAGFYGDSCEREQCRSQVSTEPYQKVLRKLDHTKTTYNCGLWGWRTCTRKKAMYKLVYRTFFRTIHKCI